MFYAAISRCWNSHNERNWEFFPLIAAFYRCRNWSFSIMNSFRIIITWDYEFFLESKIIHWVDWDWNSFDKRNNNYGKVSEYWEKNNYIWGCKILFLAKVMFKQSPTSLSAFIAFKIGDNCVQVCLDILQDS